MAAIAQPASPASVPGPRAFAPALAFAWGLAEATVFFILPDAWLTRVALRDFRRALRLSAWSCAGALLGATLLWSIAHRNQDHTQVLLNTADRLPGISRDHIVRSAQVLHEQGVVTAGAGALLGQPYKLFAVHAGAQDMALAPFLALSAVGILARLALGCTLATLAARAMGEKRLDLTLRLHAWLWMGAYAAYFALVR